MTKTQTSMAVWDMIVTTRQGILNLLEGAELGYGGEDTSVKEAWFQE